ncbi:CRISPR-associated endonuclease Cas3'' [Blautia glucerasea]|uniref:CRISPR-associated endonuclease Cas3'' n=1 Tax=Blautia glucerasea TaxID=536633 RepID=UPI00156F57AF|nr:CRISPR-associated endonuclease Cas3'' [Blautia glucerasea]NSJ26458.1 CRISPR-associated endonuclease Cas3'' [Blautia glucerasea]
MEYIAHKDGERVQTVKEHLYGTAELEGSFAEKFGKKEWGYCCGILHDLGKYSKEFQRKIQNDTSERVDHSTAGAKVCNEKGGYYSILSYCIAGHHAGLPDYGNTAIGNSLCGRCNKKICDFENYKNEIQIPKLHTDPIVFDPTKNLDFSKGIHETTEYLEVFLRNLLLNEKNELLNRNLHISRLLNEEKVDIRDRKVDIRDQKVDIQNRKVDIRDQKVDIRALKVNVENIFSGKCNNFTVKTTVNIHRLFAKFGFDEVFGRSAVMEILELKSSGASKLLSNLVQADIIEPVSGYGKGKYKFKK